MKGWVTILLCGYIGIIAPAGAYEVETHAAMTLQAYKKSVLASDPQLLTDLGIENVDPEFPFGITYYDVQGSEVRRRYGSTDTRQKIEDVAGVAYTIPGWLMHGAIREDEIPNLFGLDPDTDDDPYDSNYPRVVNHFYDPIYGRGLFGIPFVDSSLEIAAPTWGLGVIDAFQHPGVINESRRNHFSIQDAIEAIYRALTGKSSSGVNIVSLDNAGGMGQKDMRNAYWATAFRVLGSVVHLIQDMGQPQHTRNDIHNMNLGHGEEIFEKYTNTRVLPDEQFKCVSGGLYNSPDLKYGNYPVPRFDHYSRYFSTRDLHAPIPIREGLADFSNREFFSAGTNLNNNRYDFPPNDPGAFQPYALENPIPCATPQEGVVQNLLLGSINDPLTPGYLERLTRVYPNSTDGIQVPKTAFGLWDFPEFGVMGQTKAKYALTEHIYEAQADVLIPRAVAYSAGLIDFFFRGKIKVDSFIDGGNQIEVTVRNVSGDNYPLKNGTFDVCYDAIDGKRKCTQAMSGAAVGAPGIANDETWSVVVTKPSDVDTSLEAPYTIVFLGDIGEERGIAATRRNLTSPGFIVNPDYTPADGIGGSRLIYQENGQWKVGDQTGFTGGNIDWKGWYVNGIPTRVLTWVGPQARYTPNYESMRMDSKDNRYPFTKNIYQDGELYAVAPYPVLGAALQEDAQGDTWLVVICKSGVADVVYRRPNGQNTSDALYDPDTAPDGWQELAVLASDYEAADIPWFFNGSGTEAQTMRRMYPDSAQWRARLKLTVNRSAVVLSDQGNLEGIYSEESSPGAESTEDVREKKVTCDDGRVKLLERTTRRTENASQDFSRYGEYIVAVDYKDDAEVLAKWKMSGDGSNNYSYESVYKEIVLSPCGNGGTETSFTSHMESTSAWSPVETLEFSGSTFVMFSTDRHEVWTNHDGVSAITQTTDGVWTYVDYMDLRAGLLVWEKNSEKDVYEGEAPGGSYCHKEDWGTVHMVASPNINAGVQIREPSHEACHSGNNHPFTAFTPARVPQPYEKKAGPGPAMVFGMEYPGSSWAVDRVGNVFVSMNHYDENYERLEGVTFFSGGDPGLIIPGSDADPYYHPIYIK